MQRDTHTRDNASLFFRSQNVGERRSRHYQSRLKAPGETKQSSVFTLSDPPRRGGPLRFPVVAVRRVLNVR